MNRKSRTVLALILVFALLAVMIPSAVLAEGKRSYFSGYDCVVDPLDMGTMKDMGNGKALYTSHDLDVYQTNDPRINGNENIHFHLLFDTNTMAGIVWGDIEIVNAAGSWYGYVVGKSELLANGDLLITYHGIALGKGAYKGLMASLDYRGVPKAPPAGCYFTVSGYIEKIGSGRH
jgi:hypothetical protein